MIKTLIGKLKTLRLYFVMCGINRKSKSKMEELYENHPVCLIPET